MDNLVARWLVLVASAVLMVLAALWFHALALYVLYGLMRLLGAV